MDSNTALILLGALLLLIGIIGGGFEIKEVKIPKVSIFPRIAAITLGVLLIGKFSFFPSVQVDDLSINRATPEQKNFSEADVMKIVQNIQRKQESGEEIGRVDCASESGLRSVDSEVSTSIQFQNNSNIPVDIYWIDNGGNRKLYANLSPNQGYTQQTYISHPWVVTGVDGKCLGIYFPKQGTGDITIIN
jgi:hypothetical protein